MRIVIGGPKMGLIDIVWQTVVAQIISSLLGYLMPFFS